MSQENTEIVRRGYEAFNRRDVEGLRAEIAPGFEYISTGEVPGAVGTYSGLDGLRQFARWLQEQFDEARVEVHELTEAGDRVLASVTLRGRGRQSGIDTSWDLWHVWTLHNGKVIRGQAITSRTEALEAAGLSE